MANINLSTENAIVNAVGKMAFTGNVIPEIWYKSIVNSKGKVNLLSVNLLAEIVYWYRPSEIRDEMTGDVSWKQKFSDKDFLQRSYGKICEKYNVTAKQAREALIVLENLGVVKRHFRTIETELGKFPNVMFIELIPEVLYKLTFEKKADGTKGRPSITSTDDKSSRIEKDKTPSCTGADVCPEQLSFERMTSYPKEVEVCQKQGAHPALERRTSLPEGKQVFTKKETYAPLQGKTNTETSTMTSTVTSTENSTETSTESTTTAQARDVVEQIAEIFAPLGLSDKNIRAIAKASGYDIGSCERAKAVYDEQRKEVKKPINFLIAALRDNYEPASKISPVKNPFNSFSMQIYTPEVIDAMEKEILGSYGQVP